MTYEQKALEILRSLAKAVSDGKSLTLTKDWGFGTATLVDKNGSHTHFGEDSLESDDRNFEAFVDGLYSLLLEKRGLSWWPDSGPERLI